MNLWKLSSIITRKITVYQQKRSWLNPLKNYEPQLQKWGIAVSFFLCVFIGFSETIPAQSPNGSNFLVNTETNSRQRTPGVAVDADGDFVVVWTSQGQDTDGNGMYGQRYDKDGDPQGGEFQINTHIAGHQENGTVACDDNGNFVVTWTSRNGQDGSDEGIYLRRYASDGTPLDANEVLVNTNTTGTQKECDIAMDSDGDFVITFTNQNPIPGLDNSDRGVYARRYASDGTPKDVTEFLVNTYTTDRQDLAKVAMDAAGNFVVTWVSNGQDGSDFGVYAQRYNSSGVTIGSEFLVPSNTMGHQISVKIDMNNSGEFIILWHDSHLNIPLLQAYQSDGTPKFPSPIDAQGVGSAGFPGGVAMDNEGNFVVNLIYNDSHASGIFGQHYNYLGQRGGVEFQSNEVEPNNQYFSDIAMDDEGDFVLVWQDDEQDGSLAGVYAQLYDDFDVPVVSAPIPTLSQWGLINLALLLLIAGALVLLQPKWSDSNKNS